jgi:hypothetical protein
MSDDTTLSTCRDTTSNRVLCRRSLYQSIVSSHQSECRVVVHYIKVSCHHTTRHSDWCEDTILWYNERRHNTVWCDDTTRWCTEQRHDTSIRVSCRRSLHQSVVSSHQTECCVVAHYIKVSCHHIKQSVVSSFITSKCRVITSTRVLYRRSLHQRVVSSHQTECCVIALCLMWWHDTMM